jgi:hypothetical protein
MAAVHAVRPLVGEISERTGVAVPVLTPLGMLRNAMPDRVVSVDDFLHVFPYQPADQVRGALDGLIAAGLLEPCDLDGIKLATSGRSIVEELFSRTQAFIDEHWGGQPGLVSRLLPIAQRACAAVAATGGPATRVMAPPYEPENASPGFLLAETLTPLRFHRSDAHVAAWQAEGLTAEQVQQLKPGRQRQRIEAETNRLAAPPYAALNADQRFTLLAGLGALPN